MGSKIKLAGSILVLVVLAGIITEYLRHSAVAVFNPAGIVAAKERNLIVAAVGLMLLIVVPVLILTFVVAYRYRAGNAHARYTPNWDGSRLLETIWWAFPCAIIAVIAILTWSSSHTLDPFRPLDSATKALPVQVVALQWRWLFIYPQQHIASLNMLEIPAATPINFELTSDAPMNSFWIPRLGGQVYAMPGMATQLHLMANQPGTYVGRSANISGSGFANMEFATRSASQADFNAWVNSVRRSGQNLSLGAYNQLAKPSLNNQLAVYASTANNLFSQVVDKYNTSPGGLVVSHSHGGDN